jgi:hypothetical protein
VKKGPEDNHDNLDAQDSRKLNQVIHSKDAVPQDDRGPGVHSHLWFAIFCLLWFFRFGIIAIIHASRVNSRLQTGDHEGASASSKAARKWCWISVASPPILLVVTVLSLVIIASFNPARLPSFTHCFRNLNSFTLPEHSAGARKTGSAYDHP